MHQSWQSINQSINQNTFTLDSCMEMGTGSMGMNTAVTGNRGIGYQVNGNTVRLGLDSTVIPWEWGQ